MTDTSAPAAPLDLDRYLAIPRVAGLAGSPDGTRLVTSVALPAADGKRFASALWAIDPAGDAAPVRLTRSGPGEQAPAFLPDGSLLFASGRPDPAAKPDADGGGDDDGAGLWLLPRAGGEARRLLAPGGGVEGIAVARTAGTIVLAVPLHPGATDLDADREREKARHDAGVSALLFDGFPIRLWDHYLGPREVRLLALDPPSAADPEAAPGRPRDLTPTPGRALDDASFAVTSDGSTVVTTWQDWSDLTEPRIDLMAIDVSSGERRTLASGPRLEHGDVAVSPDGTRVVCTRVEGGTPDTEDRDRLWLVDLASGEGRTIAGDLDRWPTGPRFTEDGTAVVFCADDHGMTAAFRVDLESDEVTRLAADGAYSALVPAPDGGAVYAIRADQDRPPEVVVFDAHAADQTARRLRSPADGVAETLPGRVERVTATAADGATVEGWLTLPPGASAERPAPLAVFVHGGPLSSHTGWQWRWSAQLFAARGWAVLAPDPALSTGYGQAWVARGRGRWGQEPYTDVIAAVDAAVARRDVDEAKTALLGGSFGGYMANWVAGHTDRFGAIVTHASLWALRGFHGPTDGGPWWEQEFGDPYAADADPATSRYELESPHHHVDAIATPMLVIHGERDHRVPIDQALRLWTDLRRRGKDARFLYFPDENHWILKPQNVRLWYDTVLGFLAEHVLGEAPSRPPLV